MIEILASKMKVFSYVRTLLEMSLNRKRSSFLLVKLLYHHGVCLNGQYLQELVSVKRNLCPRFSVTRYKKLALNCSSRMCKAMPRHCSLVSPGFQAIVLQMMCCIV